MQQLRLRGPWLALALASACAPPTVVREIDARYPGATYETQMLGCAAPGESRRRFEHDLRGALLWSREQVRGARYFPCRLTIRADHGGTSTPVYRLSLTHEHVYEERIVADTL